MRKPQRIENAIKELQGIHMAIDMIQDEINGLEFMDDLTDDEKHAKEKALNKELREKHGNLTYWADRFLKLMRNNEAYFGDGE